MSTRSARIRTKFFNFPIYSRITIMYAVNVERDRCGAQDVCGSLAALSIKYNTQSRPTYHNLLRDMGARVRVSAYYTEQYIRVSNSRQVSAGHACRCSVRCCAILGRACACVRARIKSGYRKTVYYPLHVVHHPHERYIYHIYCEYSGAHCPVSWCTHGDTA